DDDPWTASVEPSSMRDPQWTPLQTWNPSSRNWSLQRFRPFHYGRKPDWYTRTCCMRSMAVLILLSIALTSGIVYGLHANDSFNGNLGPKGGVPMSAPGPPLPVRGVLNNNFTIGIYFGAAIDWQVDDPQNFNREIKKQAAIQESTFYLDDQDFLVSGNVNSSGIIHQVEDRVSWTAALIRGTGAVMGMTVIPQVPLQNISLQSFKKVAEKCKMVNEMGVPVMLRFAPEMNGNWYPYGQQPKDYIRYFQNLTALVRNVTNNTAMVWSPASGLGYPFESQIPRNDTRFVFLDTNGDGTLSEVDDPFTPYYPGDQYVDWVGLVSLYTGSPANSRLYPI
ncbi:glycoside hydrolase superfamily, partial [Gorgonomyces haynaldii]